MFFFHNNARLFEYLKNKNEFTGKTKINQKKTKKSEECSILDKSLEYCQDRNNQNS